MVLMNLFSGQEDEDVENRLVDKMGKGQGGTN